MESFVVLLKLICAHLCSDFIFQTDAINKGKRKPRVEGLGYQSVHSLIHACVAYLFVADWSCWLIPVVIFVSHFAIDMVKCNLHKDSLAIFLADQFAHIVVIGSLWLFLYGEGVDLTGIVSVCPTNCWLIAMAYLLMLKPSSVFLSMFLSNWTSVSPNPQSLPNAGKWIGYIERVLILTFVLIGSFEGVGFLIAAKSVFRFGDLNKTNEIRTTEYVLIGTLASFAVAILTGLAVSRLL